MSDKGVSRVKMGSKFEFSIKIWPRRVYWGQNEKLQKSSKISYFDIWLPLGRLGCAKMGQKLTFQNLRLEGDSRLNFGDKHVKDTQKLF